MTIPTAEPRPAFVFTCESCGEDVWGAPTERSNAMEYPPLCECPCGAVYEMDWSYIRDMAPEPITIRPSRFYVVSWIVVSALLCLMCLAIALRII